MKLNFKMVKPGFTFVELLVALSLFAVGMIGVLQVFPLNRRFLVQSGNATQAVFLAQEKMEEVRALPYDSIQDQSAQAVTTTAGDQLIIYSVGVDSELLDSSYGTGAASDIGLKRVNVRVSWPERSGTRTYTLSTIVSET